MAISWDTYDKGDYDVYLRRVRFTDQIAMDAPIPIAATVNFEARSSLAYDAQNRLWIAYEVAGSRWGKDFGAFDTTGLPLYSSHTIQVRCLIGNDLYSTTDDVANTLPGAPANAPVPERRPGGLSSRFPIPRSLKIARRTTVSALPPDPGTTFHASRPTRMAPCISHSANRPALGFRPATPLAASSVGSIWVGAMVYFDGAQWHGPGVLGFTDAVGDNRPSIVALGSGTLVDRAFLRPPAQPAVRRDAANRWCQLGCFSI